MEATARDRPAGGVVSLREITGETVVSILKLSVHEGQKRLVATNAESIAQAHFCEHAWFRAIYAGDRPVGFVMLDDQPQKPEYWLWRFMIDVRHQGRGYGRAALQLVVEHVKTRPGASELLTGVVQREGNAERFYEKLGFIPTGEIDDGEVVMRLPLRAEHNG